MTKLELFVHLGHWYITPTYKWWYKTFEHSDRVMRTLSFLCFTLTLTNKCGFFDYIKKVK